MGGGRAEPRGAVAASTYKHKKPRRPTWRKAATKSMNEFVAQGSHDVTEHAHTTAGTRPA
jgi:hypothetical protein